MSTKTDGESSDSKKIPTMTIKDTPSSIHIKLDGSNYRVWSKILEMHIAGRKKMGYITGRKAAPAEDDPDYDEWEAENALVKSWLINSMSENLMSHFVQCGTAKEVWDAVKRSYLDISDSSQVYELMKKSFQLRQGGRPLAEYYNELNSIFMELDYRRPNDMTCAADIEKYRKRIAEDRVYIFLAGLDHNLDQVASRVLATSPLPKIEEAYSLVRREEQRQVTMGAEIHSEVSALAVQKSNPVSALGNSTSQSRFCTHCHKNTHTVDVCWKKHGYPEWYKLKQAERKNRKSAQNVATTDPTPSFASHVSRASSKEGIFGLSIISTSPNTWVIDSGATDHMTSNSSIIGSLTSPPVKSVQVANGNSMPITGAGNVSLSPTFSMSSVLIAPKLSNNLLSISKITKDLNCSVIFHSSHCIFQDNLTKMTIGIGRERNGLYYLEDHQNITAPAHGFQTKRETFNREKIFLWHCRLGHPSFTYLERVFPKLFSNISVSSLRCEQCIYAKSHRVPFKVSFNKSTIPFSCVHTDVWGPFSTASASGHKYFVSFIDDCTRVSWVYLMKSKSDVLHIIPQFYNMILTQFNTKVKVFHSDNGREFVNQSLAVFMTQHGILHQTTCVYTPQQNGIAERKNRHILEVARALCFAMHVPKRFWTEAVLTAVFLINRMPARILLF